MKADKNKIRKRLTEKAEKMKALTALSYRVARILRHMGYNHQANIWKNFDVLMMYEIRDNRIRHEVLKRVFSKRGGRLIIEDEEWIEKIEKKVGLA